MTNGGSSKAREWGLAALVALIPAAALVWHALTYLPLVYDDSYIALRYAKRLIEGHGLTWTAGEAVEGYSNLLWVLGCAALGWLGIDLVLAARLLGIAGGIAAVAALVYAYRPRGWSTSLPAAAGGMFLALAGPIAIWAVAGLEGCLVAALVAWSVVLLRPILGRQSVSWREIVPPAIPLALMCLTRVDGPLLTVAVCAFLLAQAGSLRAGVLLAFKVGAIPGLVTLGQIAFRLLYYGDWIANTARAKVAFTGARVFSGLGCVSSAGEHAYALWIPAVAAVIATWRDIDRRARTLLAASIAVIWTVYALAVTCRPFGYRMLIPVYVMLAFLAAEGIDWALARWHRFDGALWVGALLVLALFGWQQQQDRNISMARGRVPTLAWKGCTIGTLLRKAFTSHDPLVAVDAAGAIPYYSELRSLDMLGLNDAHIARTRSEQFGHGLQGHELGDGEYILRRKPDILITGILGGERLSGHGGRQLERDRRFYQQYRPVRMWGSEPIPLEFVVWCRLEGNVGVRRGGSGVTIPGHLFASKKGTTARLNAGGELGTAFTSSQPALLKAVALPAGRWRLSARGSGILIVEVRPYAEAAPLATGEGGVELQLDRSRALDITVATSGRDAAFLEALVARREAG